MARTIMAESSKRQKNLLVAAYMNIEAFISISNGSMIASFLWFAALALILASNSKSSKKAKREE